MKRTLIYLAVLQVCYGDMRRVACHMGQNIKFMQEIGKPERAERFAQTLNKFRAQVKKDREHIFYQLLLNERMRKVMGVELV